MPFHRKVGESGVRQLKLGFQGITWLHMHMCSKGSHAGTLEGRTFKRLYVAEVLLIAERKQTDAQLLVALLPVRAWSRIAYLRMHGFPVTS